jgi:hypothetical protein
MKKIKIEITFGAKFDRDGNILLDVPIRLQHSEFEMMRIFGAFTRAETFGGWRSPETGIGTFENGYALSAIVDDSPGYRGAAHDVAAYIKGAFNQEAVCLTITPCEFQLV